MAFHLRGTVLPDGSVRDVWTLGDRITFERPSQPADTLADGGFLLPGLVDVHTHPGAPSEDEPAFDAEAFAAQVAQHRDAGTIALRFPGLLGGIPAGMREAPDSPRMVSAGRWLAWAGLSKSAPFHTVTDDLVAAAVAEARAHDGWCKLLGDWDFEADPVPFEVLRAVTDAVHAAGGRVAAHCQSGRGTVNAARAGVDSVEHGMGMPEECVDLMAAHGTVYVPTLTAFARSAPRRTTETPSRCLRAVRQRPKGARGTARPATTDPQTIDGPSRHYPRSAPPRPPSAPRAGRPARSWGCPASPRAPWPTSPSTTPTRAANPPYCGIPAASCCADWWSADGPSVRKSHDIITVAGSLH